ncbi:hypothetical protein Zmor_028084 [Zophobas morio]|uniref:Ionotropic receptor n=1 Tax=Zophobas morio TaxID=2755281 RepID=A0AA38HS26_9CUCU|nr:hypothetical protein Zmor_028084 [Zophobas morio]
MSHTLFLIIFTQTFTLAFLKLNPFPEEDRQVRESLTMCVKDAAQRFFKNGPTIFYSLPLNEVNSNQTSSTVLDRLILFELTKNCQWALFVKNLTLDDRSTDQGMYKPNYYIIQLRDKEEFWVNLNILKTYTNWNPHAKFLIIAPRLVEKPRPIATYIMKTLWKIHVVNGVVLLPDKNNKTLFHAYSWLPYKDDNCGEDFDRVNKIDSCSFGKTADFVDWYEDKIPKIFNQCVVKVRVVDFPPYVMQVPNGSTNRGVEINLLDLVGEVYNLHMVYYSSQTSLDWGNIFDNGTITGNLKHLYDEDDDVSIGAYAKTMTRSVIFEDTFYHYESLVCCVPYSTRNTKLQTVTKIMGVGAFLLTLIVYVTVTALMWVTSKDDLPCYKNFGSCTMNTFSALLDLPVSALPRTSKVRFFLAMLLLYSFSIVIAYQTLLSSTLASGTNHQTITRIEDLLDTSMNIYAINNTSRYFATDGTYRKTNKINAAILKKWVNCKNPHECLNLVAFERKAAVIFPRLFTEYIVDSYRTPENDPLIYCFDKSMVSYPLVIMMRKGFQLFDKFDVLISRIVNSGFVQKWEREILRTRFENFTSSGEVPNGNKEPDFDSLKHIFGVWGIGCGVAVVVFVLEVVYYRWVNKEK